MSDPIKPTYPAWHLFSGRPYVPANSTDIRVTFERFRPSPVKRWMQTVKLTKEAA